MTKHSTATQRKIQRYRRKCKRLVENAKYSAIVKVHENNPEVLRNQPNTCILTKRNIWNTSKGSTFCWKALQVRSHQGWIHPVPVFPDEPHQVLLSRGIIQNNRKRYEIEKKWDQLAEHYNSYIYTPSKILVWRNTRLLLSKIEQYEFDCRFVKSQCEPVPRKNIRKKP